MKKIKQILLAVLTIILFSLFLTQYTKQIQEGEVIESFSYNGTAIIFYITAIASFIIAMKITNMWKKYLLARFEKKQGIEFRYDLIIFLILLANIVYRFTITDTNKKSEQLITTTFSYGIDNKFCLGLFIAAGIFIIVLRIYVLSKFIIVHRPNSASGAASGAASGVKP